jgi:hypothetical protein
MSGFRLAALLPSVTGAGSIPESVSASGSDAPEPAASAASAAANLVVDRSRCVLGGFRASSGGFGASSGDVGASWTVEAPRRSPFRFAARSAGSARALNPKHAVRISWQQRIRFEGAIAHSKVFCNTNCDYWPARLQRSCVGRVRRVASDSARAMLVLGGLGTGLIPRERECLTRPPRSSRFRP